MPDPVCVVLPVRDPDRLPAAVADWRTALRKLGRPAELVVVDDGSASPVEVAGVRVLRHDAPQGFGASLRTALAATDQPLVATCSLDYPYTPADLAGLLAEAETEQEVTGGLRLRPSLVSGCRGGRPAPAGWHLLGVGYRLLARVCFGFRPEPPPGWLGVRGHAHSWLGWLLYGSPLHDPASAFRVYRRELFELFPVQSAGDFAGTEVVGKAVFCTQLLAEVPLTPSPAAAPASSWAGWWAVFARPLFTPRPMASPVPADG